MVNQYIYEVMLHKNIYNDELCQKFLNIINTQSGVDDKVGIVNIITTKMKRNHIRFSRMHMLTHLANCA